MKEQSGQTFLEILLAFSISILVLSAVILGVTTSLSNAQYTRNQGLANSYAQEGMSVVRKMRDSSWTDFNSKTNGDYCIARNSTTLEAVASENCDELPDIFRRVVNVIRNTDDCAAPTPNPPPAVVLKGNKVTVTVSWTDNKCLPGNPFCHKVELISCFSNTFSDIDQTLLK
jgi:type II secretory pathway pseudopilin PulG